MLTKVKRATGFLQHRGKEIYFVDLANCTTADELIEAIHVGNEFRAEYILPYGKRDLLLLVDIAKSPVFGEAFHELKRTGKELQPITKKKAFIGLNSAKKTLMNIYNKVTFNSVKVFDTKEEALNWLVQ